MALFQAVFLPFVQFFAKFGAFFAATGIFRAAAHGMTGAEKRAILKAFRGNDGKERRVKKSAIGAICFLIVSAGAYCAQTETADVYEPTAIPRPARKKLPSLFSKKVAQTVTLSEFSLFRYNYLNTKVNIEPVEIFYEPKYQEVGLTLDAKGSRYLTFDPAALRDLRAAFDQYDAAFEAKTLVTKKTKYAHAYGKIPVHYIVRNLLGDIPYEPVITCGYVFVGQSPYFIITVPETKSTLHNPVDDERTRTSTPVKLLFNRNQMRTFLTLTQEENVAQALQAAAEKVDADAAEPPAGGTADVPDPK
ncbi:MAG: hypothetical protein HDR32_04250 [Treponema sp.]|nr:hypothetical protein [Treponema sp.]